VPLNRPQSGHYVALAIHCRRCGKFLRKYFAETDGDRPPSAYQLWVTRSKLGRRDADMPVQAWDRDSKPWLSPDDPGHRGGQGTRLIHQCAGGRPRTMVVSSRKIRFILTEMWAPHAHEVRRAEW